MCISSPETDRRVISKASLYQNLGLGWWGQEVEGVPALFIFLRKVGRIKKQLCSFTKHQRLVTFILFKPLTYSFTQYLSSTRYVLGIVQGAWRSSGEQMSPRRIRQ